MGARRRAGLQSVANLPEEHRSALEPIVDRLARMSGEILPAVKPLASNATTAQLIAKINEIIRRLQED